MSTPKRHRCAERARLRKTLRRIVHLAEHAHLSLDLKFVIAEMKLQAERALKPVRR